MNRSHQILRYTRILILAISFCTLLSGVSPAEDVISASQFSSDCPDLERGLARIRTTFTDKTGLFDKDKWPLTRTGTGFFVRGPAGQIWIITASHVVSLDNDSDRRNFKARPEAASGCSSKIFRPLILVNDGVIAIDKNVDIALLKYQTSGHSDIQPLQMVVPTGRDGRYAIRGYPEIDKDSEGDDTGISTPRIKERVVLSEPFNEGFSGAPLRNENGQVIGIATNKFALANKSEAVLFIGRVSKFLEDTTGIEIDNEIEPEDKNLAKKAREQFRKGRDYFELASESYGTAAAFPFKQAIDLFTKSVEYYSDRDGKESELINALHSLAQSSERLGYVDHRNIRFYWLDGNKIVWTETRPRSENKVPQWPTRYQGGKFECKQIVEPDLWKDARRFWPKVYHGLSEHFAPSPDISKYRAIQAKNVAYFFVCDCLRKENNSLDLAINAIGYSKKLASVRMLDIRERYESLLAKLEFIETLRLTGCSTQQESFQKVSIVPDQKPSQSLRIENNLVS